MQTNRSREREKKPFLWIIPVIAVLLAGAFAFYSQYMRRHSPQDSAPVAARGKIPPPPPAPSMDSPDKSSVPGDAAPPAETENPDEPSGNLDRNGLESTPMTSMEAGPQGIAPELKSEIAAVPHEDAAAGTTPVPEDETGQTGPTGSPVDQASGPVPGNGQPETTSAAEPQVAVRETPAGPQPSDSTTTQLSDQTAMSAGPTQEASPAGALEKAVPYTIQVGAYRSKNNADRQVAQMQEKGFEAYLYEKSDKDHRAWYFVRYGRFGSFNAAKQALAALKEQQGVDGAIVHAKSN